MRRSFYLVVVCACDLHGAANGALQHVAFVVQVAPDDPRFIARIDEIRACLDARASMLLRLACRALSQRLRFKSKRPCSGL